MHAGEMANAPILLSLVLALSCIAATARGASTWSLNTYTPCGSFNARDSLIPNDVKTPVGAGSISLSSDEDVLWLAVAGVVYKTEFSTGAILGTFDFHAAAPGNSGGARRLVEQLQDKPRIAAMTGGRVALVDGMTKAIRVIGGSDSLMVLQDIPLSFVPGAITFDGPYQLFYIANAEDFVGAAPGTRIMEVTMTGNERELFVLDNEPIPNNTATSIHYASHTGTMFVLCSSCGTIVEVTLSGRLRSTTSSLLTLDSSHGEVLSLTFHRLGSPMLLLKSSLDIDSLCQDSPPALPVLPPPTATVVRPQSWVQLDNYAFCGAFLFEQTDGKGFVAMALDASLRTVWVTYEGSIREYSMRGQLLREIPEGDLAALGVVGVTSVAWMSRNKLLLGMQQGNQIAVLNTAPASAKARIPDLYREAEGIPQEVPLEPPGQDAEADFLRIINESEVEDSFTVSSDVIPPDSLGAITYSPETQTVFITALNGTTVVTEVDLMGFSGEAVLTEDVASVSDVNALFYSSRQDSFLVWDSFNAELTEVAVSEGAFDSRDFDFFITTPGEQSSAAGMTKTPDGALLLISGSDGEVSFHCGTDNENSSDVADRVRDGEEPGVDPDYYWRYQQLLLEDQGSGSFSDVATRSIDPNVEISFNQRFGWECKGGGGLANIANVRFLAHCQASCEAVDACRAFTYNFRLSTCDLTSSTCDQQVQNIEATVGIKEITITEPEEPSSASFCYLNDIRCQGRNLVVIKETATEEVCEAMCTERSKCMGYTFIPSEGTCRIKKACTVVMDEGQFTAMREITPAEDKQASDSFCHLNGILCKGRNLKVIEATEPELCEAECTKRNNCKAYSFTPADGKCRLKRACRIRKDSTFVTAIKKVSTPDTPAPTPAPTSAPTSAPGELFEMFPGVGCKDPNLEIIRRIDMDQCQSECYSRSACKAFTINDSGSCFLKSTCNEAQSEAGDTSGAKPGVEVVLIDIPIKEGGSLIGGWVHRDGQQCEPWEDRKCGLGDALGLKVGDISWYRMFAHEANPLRDEGDGVMHWTPYRDRNKYGGMYYKGSEIVGYFDTPWSLAHEGDEMEVTFLWLTEGEIQQDICGRGLGDNMDCSKCAEDFEDETDERYIYHEVRCFSGTGDFRVGLLDSRGERITNDGYGYFNSKVTDYLGLQWRFHPHACPTVPRESPFGYAAVAAQSWIRDACCNDNWLNSQSLILDYIEKGQDEWYSDLGDTRSFKSRLFDPADDGACLNLENGKWTPEEKPFRMYLKIVEKGRDETKFTWRMEFNGWVMESTETWDSDRVPEQIDSIVIGYTNSRSYTKLKLKRV